MARSRKGKFLGGPTPYDLMRIAKYLLEQEQADNKARLQAITDELQSASDTENDVRRFIGKIREYASITELDEAILNRLIDKITISAVEVIDGEKVQKVRIIYNFMGEITKA